MKTITIALSLCAFTTVLLFNHSDRSNIILGSLIGTVSILLVIQVLLPRTLMYRRARVVESEIGNSERKVVPVLFRGLWAGQKKIEIDAVKEEMSQAGWQFLKVTAAADSRMRRTMNGGVDVHFIRSIPDSGTLHAH